MGECPRGDSGLGLARPTYADRRRQLKGSGGQARWLIDWAKAFPDGVDRCSEHQSSDCPVRRHIVKILLKTPQQNKNRPQTLLYCVNASAIEMCLLMVPWPWIACDWTRWYISFWLNMCIFVINILLPASFLTQHPWWRAKLLLSFAFDEWFEILPAVSVFHNYKKADIRRPKSFRLFD